MVLNTVLDFAPYRLSGTVYSILLNDQRFVRSLGEQALSAPYKSPPKAPVLSVKPRSCWAAADASIEVPVGSDLQTGACFGLVIKRDLCNLGGPAGCLVGGSEKRFDLCEAIAGVCLVNECSLPFESHYRPAVAQKARDGHCIFASKIIPFESAYQERSFEVLIDNELLQRQNGLVCHDYATRNIEQLLIDVTNFMTLKAGDIVLLGASFRSPVATLGQSIEIRSPQFGTMRNTVVAAQVES